MPEHEEQVAFFKHVQERMKDDPAYECVVATPNGGRRSKFQGMWLKAEGMSPGFPDISVHVARGGYHGMFIEMKYGTNKTSKKQDDWLIRLHQQGYYVLVSYSHEDAIEQLEAYMSGAKKRT